MNTNWRDFFYFSKGEKQALSILLALVSTAWVLVMFHDKRQMTVSAEQSQPLWTANDTVAAPAPSSTALPASSTWREGYHKPTYERKFPAGTVVELNTADTTTLKRVPKIGPSFARWIVNYRERLGGYYSVEQLAEVYRMDKERFDAVKDWFSANPDLIRRVPVNRLSVDSLARHPYISFRQAEVMKKINWLQGGVKGWDDLQMLEEFPATERERLEPYLSFE